MRFATRSRITSALIIMFISGSSQGFINPAFASDNAIVKESTEMTGSVQGYPIWKGAVPTKATIAPSYAGASKPCGYLVFSIEAIAPQSELLNRSTGLDVDFELWSTSGAKIGSSSLSAYSWNPVGTTNQVKIFLCDENTYGTHTLLILNKRTLSTNGLLSRYLEEKVTSSLTIEKPLPLPSAPGALKGTWVKGSLKYSFSAATSSSPILMYEVLIANSLPGVKAPKKGSVQNSSFGEFKVIRQITGRSFTLTKKEILEMFPDLNAMYLVKVRAVNSGGAGPIATGLYTTKSQMTK